MAFPVVSLFRQSIERLGLALVCLVPLHDSRGANAAKEWKDAKGGTFRGEPVEAIGPVALIRTGGMSSKFLPMCGLSPADCVRGQ